MDERLKKVQRRLFDRVIYARERNKMDYWRGYEDAMAEAMGQIRPLVESDVLKVVDPPGHCGPVVVTSVNGPGEEIKQAALRIKARMSFLATVVGMTEEAINAFMGGYENALGTLRKHEGEEARSVEILKKREAGFAEWLRLDSHERYVFLEGMRVALETLANGNPAISADEPDWWPHIQQFRQK